MSEHLRETAMNSEKRLNPLTMSSQGVQQVRIGSRIDTNIDQTTSEKHLLIRYFSLVGMTGFEPAAP